MGVSEAINVMHFLCTYDFRDRKFKHLHRDLKNIKYAVDQETIQFNVKNCYSLNKTSL